MQLATLKKKSSVKVALLFSLIWESQVKMYFPSMLTGSISKVFTALQGHIAFPYCYQLLPQIQSYQVFTLSEQFTKLIWKILFLIKYRYLFSKMVKCLNDWVNRRKKKNRKIITMYRIMLMELYS